jgi:hypothetical protein
VTTTDIALELEKLRGAMEKGFAQVDTRFAEMNGTIARVAEREQGTSADVAALTVRVTALEKRIYAVGGGAAGIGALIPYVAQLLGGGQ